MAGNCIKLIFELLVKCILALRLLLSSVDDLCKARQNVVSDLDLNCLVQMYSSVD